jgi:hypothetical protein
MCHYAQLTFPVPAVIVVIFELPEVVVDPVNPAPIVIVLADGYLKITTPEPPLDDVPVVAVPLFVPPPPPPPVLAVPFTGVSWLTPAPSCQPALPPPPKPPVPNVELA